MLFNKILYFQTVVLVLWLGTQIANYELTNGRNK